MSLPSARNFLRASRQPGDVRETVSTDDAPAAVGAYSQAVTTGDLLFTAGQLPLTVEGDLLDDAPVAEQTERCLRNVEAILEAKGASLDDVVKTTVYLDDIDDFDAFNEAYSGFFETDPPARSAVGVGDVPKGAAVEIEAIAALE